MVSETNLKNRPRVVAIVVMALAGYLVGQVLATLLDALVVSLTHFSGGLSALAAMADPPWWSNAVGLAGLWVGFGLAIYLAHHRGGLAPLAHGWRVRPSDGGYLGLGVACQLAVGVAYAPFHPKNMDKPVHHLFGAAHGAEFALLALMTVVGAPLVEEWLFRGVLFRSFDLAWRPRWGRAGAVGAVVASALVFALAHGEWLQLPGLFLLGVVLALVLRRTQRLTSSVATHVGFNALTMVSLIAQRLGH